jgi:hypothetical protein
LVFYTATYYIGLKSYTEHWFIPDNLPGPLDIKQIRAAQGVPPFPFLVQTSQLYAPNASLGDVLCYTGTTWGNVTLQEVHQFEFADVDSFIITAQQHGQGNHGLLVRLFDQDGYTLDTQYRVDPATGNVYVYFNERKYGSGFISGGPGRTLPNPAYTFIHKAEVVIPVEKHRLYTTNISIEAYDTAGYVTIPATRSVTSDFTVIVTFNAPTSGKIVLVGALGSTPDPIDVIIPDPNPGGNAGANLTGALVTTVNPFDDGESTPLTITVNGANIGKIVAGFSAVPPLPTGVLATVQVTGANAVGVVLTNLTGQRIALPSTSFSVAVLP